MNKVTSSIVPMVVQTRNNIERAMDIYSCLLEHRIIRVTGEINQESADLITSQLLYLEAENPNADIVMYINSPGGEVLSGLGIYDTMQYIKPDIVTICVGMAASMGSLLLTAGTKGKRYIFPNCQVMIHQPSGSMSGKESDIQKAAAHITHLKSRLYKLYQKHTGQTIKKLTDDMDRDNWLTAEEALEYGIIDKIITQRGSE